LFDLRNAFIETACLLTSSVTCGMAMLACDRRDIRAAFVTLAVTFLLGLVFLSLEVASSRAWSPIVPAEPQCVSVGPLHAGGTHGLHVTAGLAWLVVIVVQLRRRVQ